MSRNGARTLRRLHRHTWVTARTHHYNRMDAPGAANRQRLEPIVLRRPHNVDRIAPTAAKPPATARHPTPAKSPPVRPTAAAIRRPPPPIPPSPDVSGARIPHPPAISH